MYMAKLDTKIENALGKYINNILASAKEDLVDIVNEVNDEMYNEAVKMYDAFIKEFYKFQTRYYIRHWEGKVGTRKGTNLYYASQIKKLGGKKNPKLQIGYSGENMAGGYQYHSPDEVIDYVAAGFRFHPGENSNASPLSWDLPSYEGDFFKQSENTMIEAFEKFNNEFKTNATNLIISKFWSRWKVI